MSDEARDKRNCNGCQHFRKPLGIPNCWYIDWQEWPETGTARPDVRAWWDEESTPNGIPDTAEDCPGYMLAESILLQQHREAHGLCKYCSWPRGKCHHTDGRPALWPTNKPWPPR